VERLRVGIGDLFSQELETDWLFLGSVGFQDSAARRFRRDGQPIDVFVGVGWRAGRGRTALSPKTAVPGSGWRLEVEGETALAPDGRVVRSLLYRSETQRLLVYHWYEGSLGLIAEAVRGLAALDSSPLRRSEEIVAVRIATGVDAPVAAGLGPAADRLASFYAELRRVLDRVQEPTALDERKSFSSISNRRKDISSTGTWEKPEESLEIRGLAEGRAWAWPLLKSAVGAGKPA
jgi:EpsI family protein